MPGSIYKVLGAAEISPWRWEGAWDVHLMAAKEGDIPRVCSCVEFLGLGQR